MSFNRASCSLDPKVLDMVVELSRWWPPTRIPVMKQTVTDESWMSNEKQIGHFDILAESSKDDKHGQVEQGWTLRRQPDEKERAYANALWLVR